MAEQHCRTCRFWEPPENDIKYGTCEGIPYNNQTTIAYHSDYEGYSSSLFTKPEFGCVLHEKTAVPGAP